MAAQAAGPATGIAGDEFVDHDATELLGGAVGETEVQPAHRLGVS